MISIRQCDNQQEWDEYILDNAGHPLQLWGWGAVKAAHNWRVERVFAVDMDKQPIGAAQLLIRKLPFPFKSLVYVPRGPVVERQDRGVVLEALANYAKSQYGAVAITVEPDWTEPLTLPDWHKSDNTILIPRTLILDLDKSEQDLQASMNKKTRQYIRKSAAEPITIRRVRSRDDLDKCLAIYRQTAKRAGFALHKNDYYYDIFSQLGDYSPVFAAFKDDEPVAFLWLAISQEIAFELYGGMNDEGQELRANYALKWHAIKTIKEWGISYYDMNGLLNDGVSTFKQSFADHEDMLIGTYDKALSPLYKAWTKGLPLAKKAVQKLKNR
jgi:peptidoglycan pentaglycine glycine transferase (the first glycine)